MSNRDFPLFTIKNNCQDCYKCVRQCPVKAIKIEENSAQIVSELCVVCGECYKVCPVRAKQDRDDVTRAKNLIASKQKVYVSLAPSWVSEFNNVTNKSLNLDVPKFQFSYKYINSDMIIPGRVVAKINSLNGFMGLNVEVKEAKLALQYTADVPVSMQITYVTQNGNTVVITYTFN